jgi:tRNA G18 (ribose-2'-O)-methylase SpoU
VAKGYFGVGMLDPKDWSNLGGIMRSGQVYGAAFTFVITERDVPCNIAADRGNSRLHIPFYRYRDIEHLEESLPHAAVVVPVDGPQTAHRTSLDDAQHAERAVYLMGNEATGLPEDVSDRWSGIYIPTPNPWSLNTATAATIVLADRYRKMNVHDMR